MASVLIVEDSAFMRMAMRRELELLGHRVVGEAHNGQQAIAVYIAQKPDVVTMDINMPVMNGVEATTKIIQVDPKARIIVCSAIGYSDTVRKAIAAGAKSYLLKPITREKLMQAITKVW